MLTIVTSFENRLSKLEETITPVYQETGNLQRRHESILLISHLYLGYINDNFRGKSFELHKCVKEMGITHY